MPLNKKQKIKLIRESAPQILGKSDTAWFCDENKKNEHRIMYPGFKWGPEDVIAEFKFDERQCLYFKGEIMSFSGIAFFPSGAYFADTDRENQWINDLDYNLFTVGKFMPLELWKLLMSLGRGTKQATELLFANKNTMNDSEKYNEYGNKRMDNHGFLNRLEECNLNPMLTFDNYCVGPRNDFAYKVAKDSAESTNNLYCPIFIYGRRGTGKTHLLNALGNEIIRKYPETRLIYVTAEQFTNDVIESIRSGNVESMKTLRRKYRELDVLIIDDIQFIFGKESTQEEFLHTFNVLQQAGKRVIISADKRPKELDADERFKSLLAMGVICHIMDPDNYESANLIKMWSGEMGETIDDDVIDYVVSHIKHASLELKGALNKIIAYKRLNGFYEITLEMTKKALKDIVIDDVSDEDNLLDNKKLIINEIWVKCILE